MFCILTYLRYGRIYHSVNRGFIHSRGNGSGHAYLGFLYYSIANAVFVMFDIDSVNFIFTINYIECWFNGVFFLVWAQRPPQWRDGCYIYFSPRMEVTGELLFICSLFSLVVALLFWEFLMSGE